jgi:AsmA-like protein
MRKIVTRTARYAAYAAGAFVVLVVAAALALPAFLDTPAMERDLQAKLSEAVHGEIAWDKLTLRVLPSPRGSLSRVRADIPGVASIRAEQVDAHLRLLSLLRGRAEIAAVSLSKPAIRLEIVPEKEKPAKKEPRADPFDVSRAVVDAIRGLAPEAIVTIEDAELDLRISGLPPIRVWDLDARARTGSEGMHLEVRAASVEVERGDERTRITEVAAEGRVVASPEEIAVRVNGVRFTAPQILPGPAKLGGSVKMRRGVVRIERADVAVLDARAVASATVTYGRQLRIEGAVSEGSVGESALAWGWGKASLPKQSIPKAPIRLEVQKLAWSPKQPLDLAATASFGAGPGVAVDMGWTPESLDLRSVAIRDARSDARITLRTKKRLLDGRFSGSLYSTSLAAMLKDARLPSGSVSGDLRFTVDLDRPRRTTTQGELKGESLDLAWLLDRPVKIERVDLASDGTGLRIREATVNWSEQIVRLKGDVKYGATTPVIDAQLESPGVVVDALLKRPKEQAEPAKEKPKAPEADAPLWTQWPLPVRGSIVLRSGFVQYGERKAEPVKALLTLEAERASLQLQEARLCGISFPLTAEAKPGGVLALSVQLSAQKQQLEQTAHCLTERGVQMTGEFDLGAELRTQGTQKQLLRNLQGTIRVEARQGRVKEFPLILSILSVQNVRDAIKRDASLEKEGFPYRVITASGHLDEGEFALDESFFRSDIVGFAAKGSISLLDDPPRPYDSRMTVLVAPLAQLDSLMRGIPIVGYVFGGVLTSIPVGVSGDIRRPRVVPLGPEAVGSELLGVFERTLKLPTKLLPKPKADAP